MTRPGTTRRPVTLESGETYIPVALAELRLDTTTNFDLYLIPAHDQDPVLYRGRDLPFTEAARQRLIEWSVDTLYVDSRQEDAYRRYVENNLGAILSDDNIDVAQKSDIMYTSAQGLVADVLADPRSGDAIRRSKSLVEHTVQYMFDEESAFEHLLKVTSFDYYTYTHSVNVFVFCIVLAQRLGYDDLDELRRFGDGALLHDVGKSQIDPAILNCRGRLTDAQWRVMKQHPVFGFEILTEHDTLDEAALDVVRHHHEKLTGSGYPDGLANDEVSPFVRMITIADIFDALTTRRVYKNALSSFPALKLMKEEFARELDQDDFRAFVQMIGNPSG